MKRKCNLGKVQQVLDLLKEISRDRSGLPDELVDALNTVRGDTEKMVQQERDRLRKEYYERKEKREEAERKSVKYVGGCGGGGRYGARPDTRGDGAKLGTAPVNVIGSSHLRNIEKVLDPLEFAVHCRPGATSRHMKQIANQSVEECHTVVLLAGSNDIRQGSSPREYAANMREAAYSFTGRCNNVCILPVLPNGGGLDDSKVTAFNNHLRFNVEQMRGESNANVWVGAPLNLEEWDYRLDDDVHLNRDGKRKLANAIRAEIVFGSGSRLGSYVGNGIDELVSVVNALKFKVSKPTFE